MATSALIPVSQAVFQVLNVPSLTAPPPIGAGGGRVVDAMELEGPGSFPCVWYELSTEENRSGLGAGPWLLQLDLRIHAFSTARGMEEVQRITGEAVRLMREAALTPIGWVCHYVPHDRIVSLPNEAINGVAVREHVAMLRIFVEERTL